MTATELRRELKQAFAEIRAELQALRQMFRESPELFDNEPEMVGTKGD